MLANNPFAAGGPQLPQTSAHQVGHGSSPTGPTLTSQDVVRLYNMPYNEGHSDGVSCMLMADGKVYTGGRDGNLFIWRGQPGPSGGFNLVQDTNPIALGSDVTAMHYDSASQWLFCGLFNGDIQAYCKQPPSEDRLLGHRKSIQSITMHAGVVITGSFDGTVRLWVMGPGGKFQGHGQPIANPGNHPVASVRVLGDALWVGGHAGITCFDLNSLQQRGAIPSVQKVTHMLPYENFVFVAYYDGGVKIFDAAGGQVHDHPARGDHTSNTACALMMHPATGKPMLLCGQTLGYITAYDLPDFHPRGSFELKRSSDVRAIVDAGADGMFLTGGQHGDVMVWQWTKNAGQSSSPFGAGAAGCSGMVAASPFAAGGNGMMGGMMG